MRFALTDDLPCPDRQDPVTAPYCRWRGNAGFYPRYERRNRYQWDATETTSGMGFVVTGDFAGLNPKDTTQIPIAPLTSLTAWLPPAVSSLEACQTPAR
jgi:hypothetical protein